MVLYIGFVRHVVSQVYVWFESQGLQSLHINLSTVSFSYFFLSICFVTLDLCRQPQANPIYDIYFAM